MTTDHEAIDISDNPDLLRLAEEVRKSQTPRVLRRDNEDIAVVMPVASSARHPSTSAVRTRTEADREAFLAAAGGWKDLVDTEQLKRNIAESRARSSRPLIEL